MHTTCMYIHVRTCMYVHVAVVVSTWVGLAIQITFYKQIMGYNTCNKVLRQKNYGILS